jgi:hypothetical protein
VNKQQPSSSGKEETSLPVTPTKTSDTHREEQSHDQQQRQVVVVLPPDDLGSSQVGDIGDTDLGSRLEDHPTDVSPPEPFVGRVRVEVGVGVTVVSSVASGPPLDGSLDGTGSGTGEDVFERSRGGVGSVGPQSLRGCQEGMSVVYTWKTTRRVPTHVVSSGNSQTGDEVVDDGPDSGLGVPVDVEDTVDGQGWGDSQGEERDPSGRGRGCQYKEARRGSKKPNSLNVLEQVAPSDRRQSLLSLNRAGDIVVGDINV